MILGVQIIGLIFGLLMGYIVFLHYSRKEFSRSQFLMWEALFVVYTVFVLFPHSTSGLIHALGIIRAMDLFMILGIMFVLFLSFSNYTSILKLKRKLEDQVRKEAMKEV